MSNVIVNKDRWQEKPKTRKVKQGTAKKYHKIKNKMLAEGYSLEEIDGHFKKISKEATKEEKRIRNENIKELIIKYLPPLSKEQIKMTLKIINEDFPNKQISTIEKYLIKVSSAIEK